MTLAGKFGDPKTERDIVSAKRFNFVALLVLIAVIGAAVYLYFKLVEKQHELEEKSTQLEDTTAHLRRMRMELEAAQLSIAEYQRSMEQAVQSLTYSVGKRQYDSAMVKADFINQRYASKPTSVQPTVVHLYAFQPDMVVLNKLRDYLKSSDLLLAHEEILTRLPDWFGQASAVYYYTAEAEKRARALAQALGAIAGHPFVAVPGRPEDAPQQVGSDWLHIHYLGTTPPKQG